MFMNVPCAHTRPYVSQILTSTPPPFTSIWFSSIGSTLSLYSEKWKIGPFLRWELNWIPTNNQMNELCVGVYLFQQVQFQFFVLAGTALSTVVLWVFYFFFLFFPPFFCITIPNICIYTWDTVYAASSQQHRPDALRRHRGSLVKYMCDCFNDFVNIPH